MTVGIIYLLSMLSGSPLRSGLLSIWGRRHVLCPVLLAARLAKRGEKEEEGSPATQGSDPGGSSTHPVAAHPRPCLLAPQLCS